MSTTPVRGDAAIAEILRREGVEHVFCFPYTPILDALAEAGIRPIVARQERVAENMADGFSRITNGRRIGIVTVQGAAGAENAFSGIAQAYTDSSPILFLPGHPGRAAVGVPPTFDALPNYRNTTKWADRIPFAANIPDRLRRAFTLLRTGRPGPVLLEIPGDVAKEELPGSLDYRSVPAVRTAADPEAVRDAARLLLAAERPMIWAGQGVLYAEAHAELAELAELLAAPVMTTLLGKSAFDETHPLALGTGSYSRTAMAVDYLARADLVFAIGASLTRTIFAPPIRPGIRIVHATNDPRDLNKDYAADVPLLGDAKLVLSQLTQELHHQHRSPPDAAARVAPPLSIAPAAPHLTKGGLGGVQPPAHDRPSSGTLFPERRAALVRHIAAVKQKWRARWKTKLISDQVPINPYRVIAEFLRLADPRRTIVTHDSGNPRDQLVPIYEATVPRGYLGWGHSTQLGFSLGAAMGAKLAAPEKLVVNFMGDAAFGMVAIDVETAVRERIPILTLLLNNSAMGNYERNIPLACERFGTKRLSGNYSDVARGLGAYSERIERPADIAAALQRAFRDVEQGRTTLLEFVTCEEPDMALDG